MTDAIDPRLHRLHRLLGGDALNSLRKRMRRHFERTEESGPSDGVRLTGLASEERDALASLMGRPPSRAKSMLVDVAAIDRALREAGSPTRCAKRSNVSTAPS